MPRRTMEQYLQARAGALSAPGRRPVRGAAISWRAFGQHRRRAQFSPAPGGAHARKSPSSWPPSGLDSARRVLTIRRGTSEQELQSASERASEQANSSKPAGRATRSREWVALDELQLHQVLRPLTGLGLKLIASWSARAQRTQVKGRKRKNRKAEVAERPESFWPPSHLCAAPVQVSSTTEYSKHSLGHAISSLFAPARPPAWRPSTAAAPLQ